MRQFDQEGLLSRVLARGELTPARVDEIAAAVAAFHSGPPAPRPTRRSAGRPASWAPVRQNFVQMLEAVEDAGDRA